MTTPFTADGSPAAHRPPIGIGTALLVLGLLGHVYAAHLIGGSRMAYTHHVLGFFLILAVTGAIIVAVGRRFWRSRPDVTLLTVGVVQLLLGVMVVVDALGDTAGR
jgi:hypothetical protein